MPEILVIECPFCKQETIKVMHTSETYTTQRTKAAGKIKTIPKLSPSKDEILIEKCPNCSKTKREIEEALKHGKELSREDVIKRLREAGLDPSKLK